MTADMLPRASMRRDDYPETEETRAAARAANAAERRQAEIESGGTLRFRPDGTPEVVADRGADPKVLPFDVLTFLKLPETAISRYHSLQLAESDAAAEISDRIAEVAFGAEDAAHVEGRREQAMCRFLGVHAIRMTKDCWQTAAMEKAIERCVEVMVREGGAVFVGLSDKHLVSLARLLAPKVVSAYHSISEGTLPLAPGTYLEIVNGGAK